MKTHQREPQPGPHLPLEPAISLWPHLPGKAYLYRTVQIPIAAKAKGVHQARLIVHQDCKLLQEGIYCLNHPQVEEMQDNLKFERCRKCHQATRTLCDTQMNDVQVVQAMILQIQQVENMERDQGIPATAWNLW